MFPSPMREKAGFLLDDNHQLGLSLGSNVPYITAEKLDFLATYGLELDDEEEEDDDDTNGTTSGGAKRFKRAKDAFKGDNLLKRALSPSAITSPPGTPGRAAKLVGLVTKPRSGSTASTWSPLSPNKKDQSSTGRAHSSSVSITPGNRPRASTTTEYKDYSVGIQASKVPRRGYFDQIVAEDDASSISHYSHYSPSAIFEEDNVQQKQSSTATTTETSTRSAHAAKHVNSLTPPLRILDNATPPFDDHDLHKNKMTRSTSSLGESGDSLSGKESGEPFTPPPLPARPLGPAFLLPSAPPVPRRPTSTSTTISSDSSPPPLPSKDDITGNAAQELEKVNLAKEEKVQEENTAVKETENVISKKASKGEALKIIAEKKAAKVQEKVVKKKQESRRKQEEMERKILMKSYDELEVERFLADFGKHVNTVRSSGVLVHDSAHHLPNQRDWRHSETGKLHFTGFIYTYLLSIVEYISKGSNIHVLHSIDSTSEDLKEAMPEEQFRIAALRANAERLYITALPMYEGTFAKMRRIWRWESKFKTLLWSASYFALWFRGMLLCGLFALCIWSVISIRVFPPKPEVIRQMLREQHQRSRELEQAKKAKAEDVIQQAQEEKEQQTNEVNTAFKVPKKKSKYGLAADATRKYGKVATFVTSALADLHERVKNFVMWKSIPATWRAISLLAVAMAASYLSTPWIMARLPGFSLGVCLFIIAPIAEHRPEWLGTEWKNPFDFLLAGVPNDAQYAMQVLRTRAAAGEALTGDRDIADWMRAGPDDEDDDLTLEDSLIPSMSGLEGIDGTTAVSTAVNQATATGASSVDWKKWKSRVAKGREMAVAGSEVLSGQRALQLPRLPGSDQSVKSQEALTSKMMLGMAKGVNWGLDSIQNSSNRKLMERRLEADEVTTASDGVYWAVFQGSCGHVVITPDRLRFRSMFARKVSSDATEEQVDVLDSKTGECQVSEAQAEAAVVRTLVDVNLENVIQLKKTKSVNVGIWGIDGLEVRSKGGKSFQFSSIVKRDEAFNRILALAPQYWNKM